MRCGDLPAAPDVKMPVGTMVVMMVVPENVFLMQIVQGQEVVPYHLGAALSDHVAEERAHTEVVIVRLVALIAEVTLVQPMVELTLVQPIREMSVLFVRLPIVPVDVTQMLVHV